MNDRGGEIMGKLMDKFLGWMGFEVQEEAVEEPPDWQDLEPSRKSNVVTLPSSRPVKMMVVKPRDFDQVQSMVNHLKNMRPLIINLEGADSEVSRRIVDFVGGATFALNGTVKKVAQGIFLFAPKNVDIEGDLTGMGLGSDWYSSLAGTEKTSSGIWSERNLLGWKDD
jgi:cell division inhibitor SepF